jgi:hypothetical protein
MRYRVLLFVAVVGCHAEPVDGLIVGPFSGATRRFVVDRLKLPDDRFDFARDLNGDKRVDNQLGNIVSALGATGNLSTGIDDMIASGALASAVEITADDPDLRDDDRVGIRFLGRDGAAAAQLGARLVAGKLATNPVSELRAPAPTPLSLPLFLDADPIAVDAAAAEITLTRDGRGGFDGRIAGAIRIERVSAALEPALAQMIASQPQVHLLLVSSSDANLDGMLSGEEFRADYLVRNLLLPDVDLFGGDAFEPNPMNSNRESLSFAFSFHLTPCPSGLCRAAAPANPCRDRIRDGDESDVDCGGACPLACAGGQGCRSSDDCQSRHCWAGVCAPPSCDDGVLDGLEGDIDCGKYCPRKCQLGQLCHLAGDCQDSSCSSWFGVQGTCTARQP